MRVKRAVTRQLLNVRCGSPLLGCSSGLVVFCWNQTCVHKPSDDADCLYILALIELTQSPIAPELEQLGTVMVRSVKDPRGGIARLFRARPLHLGNNSTPFFMRLGIYRSVLWNSSTDFSGNYS
jgi:hypothetical protein